MKGFMAAAILLVFFGVATAKPTPTQVLEPAPTQTFARNDADIYVGPSPANLERAYFQAPEFRSGGLPCRLEPSVFAKIRLAQSCN
jgi:hypothetical protein